MSKYRTKPILFEAFPSLEGRLAWVKLGLFPTPVHRLKKVGKSLGAPVLYIKREDLSGDLYGGNKVRKLEFTLADAMEKGKKTLVTFGGAGSNHVLATTLYGKTLGLKTAAFFMAQPASPFVERNVRAYSHYGTKMFYLKNRYNFPRQIVNLATMMMRSGYFLPPGGSNVRGTIGFVDAALEIKRQVEEKQLPEPKRIYVAAGSGGTLAGLHLGVKLAGMDATVVGITVGEKWLVNPTMISRLANSTAKLLRELDSSVPEVTVSKEEIVMTDKYFGECYGSNTPESLNAMKVMDDMESIHLENTYTGKAFAAVLDSLKENPEEPTLFINTYNSVDVYSSLPEICDLRPVPPAMRRYVSACGF